MWSKYLQNNVWKLPISVLETVAQISLKGKFTAKCNFSIEYYVTIADANIGSLKSVHT